jgi:SAM-dependent methyltransferase
MTAVQTSITRRDTCRLCHSRDLELVVPFAPSAIADDYVPAERLSEKQPTFPLDLFLCRACKHTQLLDSIDPELLFRNYTYVTSVSLGLVDHFEKLAAQLVSRFKLGPDSLVVEIGSNDGTLLRFLKQSGAKVLGIDPATEIAKRATASGIETIPTFFNLAVAEEIEKKHGKASLFIANNVFAHADNLGDIAEGIRHLLRPGGVFVFEVSYMVDIVQKMIWDTIFHEHLSYHAVRPFRVFFDLHGLELFDIERISTKGGSLRGFVQLKGDAQPIRPVIAELVALEEKLAFGEADTFRDFGARINALRDELLQLLQKLRREGKRIAGYGASATVTTLLHHFELGHKLDFIVDDNPVKQGTYSPGQHIPVLPSSALAEQKPDYVVILAWVYSGPIIQKNASFLEQGGHFIIPNPKIRIV